MLQDARDRGRLADGHGDLVDLEPLEDGLRDAIPEGLDEPQLARVKDFLYFATDTQRLADQAKYISYGPARKSSAPLVGEHATLGIDMAPHMPTNPENSEGAFVQNYEWWADYRDDLDAKFQAWLAQ